MVRVAQRFKVKSGMLEEYKRRHDDIWPEMKQMMKEAGIRNYSIWNVDNELFGYFEVDDYDRCMTVLSVSEVKKKWDKYMADIIEYKADLETGQIENMKLVFLFE